MTTLPRGFLARALRKNFWRPIRADAAPAAAPGAELHDTGAPCRSGINPLGPAEPRPAAISRAQPLPRLRRRWRLAWMAALPLLAAALWLWHAIWGAAAAVQGGLQTAALMVYLWIRTDRMLELNRPPWDARLRPRLGAANRVTLLRAALIAVLGGFLFQPALAPEGAAGWAAWVPGLLYLAAAALDAADGAIARTTGSETQLGERLDGEVDALGLFIAAALAVWLGRAPAVFLVVGCGYYLVQAAVWLRRRRGRPVGRVRPRATARITAGCAMGFTVAILLPLFAAPGMVPAAAAIITALLAGFALDWLIVCGWAAPEGRLFHPRAAFAQQTIERLLPLALRAGVVLGAGLLLARHGAGGPLQPLSDLAQGMLAGGALLAALGIATRLASAALSGVAAGMSAAMGPEAAWALTALCSAGLVVTGAGRPRLWQPEEAFFRKRAASPPRSKRDGS